MIHYNMKKLAVFLSIMLCVLCICGCNRMDVFSNNVDESMEIVTSGSVNLEKQWTEQEIRNLFAKTDIPGNWVVVDSAVVADCAYDRVGVVLFNDTENNTSNVAFLDEDGHYQRCGIYAKICEKSRLTYLGNGVVTFCLEIEGGMVYTCKITFSIKGSDASFIVEDDL